MTLSKKTQIKKIEFFFDEDGNLEDYVVCVYDHCAMDGEDCFLKKEVRENDTLQNGLALVKQ